ncbi:hypothetical protein CASFOL_040656 [Castilleja foliolosa]|uniref:Uncharacterized protein n=1 Tax=Castilleja foliolosa TaxID=1961234 RepID=A0ABD3BDS5_9LAMI
MITSFLPNFAFDDLIFVHLELEETFDGAFFSISICRHSGERREGAIVF